MSKELEEAQAAEWRQLIVQKLDNLAAKQDLMQTDLTYIKLNYARNTDVDSIKNDVSELKLAKAQYIGIMATLNVLGLVIGWMIQTYLLAKH
jgi:hypothetical protein